MVCKGGRRSSLNWWSLVKWLLMRTKPYTLTQVSNKSSDWTSLVCWMCFELQGHKNHRQLTLWNEVLQNNSKACSHYESNAHWKRINSHCLRLHWMRINRNSHWMRIQSIHFHRWFEAGLKVNCIITWNNAGVIFLRVIGYVKKPAIRQALLCCFA